MRTVIALALLLLAAPAHALDVTCGMTIPDTETAVLQGDLSCADLPIAVTVGRKATLDLNGFTLTVGEDVVAVYCAEAACTVVSRTAAPGVIAGGHDGYYGLVSNLQPDGLPPIRKLVIDNVVIRDFKSAGMYAAWYGKSVLSRLTVTGCAGGGILGQKLILRDVIVSENGFDLQWSGEGIAASKIVGDGVTVNGNADAGMRVRGPVKITGLLATGNGTLGVEAHTLVLKDSQLATNGDADIESDRRPRLKNTSCEHSNWDVCTFD